MKHWFRPAGPAFLCLLLGVYEVFTGRFRGYERGCCPL